MQKIKIRIPVCGCDRSKLITTEILTKCPICKKDYREQEITIMKERDDECNTYPVCDFCSHYNFNPDKDGCYIGLGYCTLHKWAAEPGFHCGDFECKFCMKERDDEIIR